jgi:hypothetical protein
MARVKVRTGMPSVRLSRQEFARRFRNRFFDPVFDGLESEIEKIIEAAWNGYDEDRKSPRTRPAGPGFADPTYALSDEWREASRRIKEAERRRKNAKSPSRILLINGAARSEHTCPGEMSKTFRLAAIAREIIEKERGFEVELLAALCHQPRRSRPRHGRAAGRPQRGARAGPGGEAAPPRRAQGPGCRPPPGTAEVAGLPVARIERQRNAGTRARGFRCARSGLGY